MKKRFAGNSLLVIVMLTVVWFAAMTDCPVVLAASDTEELYDAEEGEAPEVLKENSWRYQNGQPISNTTRKKEHPDAWNKVNGQFLNSEGDPIPGAEKKGMDVSEHNGTIDWNKVKADGIDFAIIRCGYGSNYISQDDKQWARNVRECERLGIPYGVYLYSYADTKEKAKSEAEHVLRLLKGHTPSFPVYYDLEDEVFTLPLTKKEKAEVATTFCNTVQKAGYQVGIYSNLDWWTNQLTDSAFDNSSWSRWVAQWYKACTYTGTYDLWQCTATGKVDGISTDVDLNFWMNHTVVPETPEPELPESRMLQYDAKTGKWNVYKDGAIDTNFTGMAQNEYGWWYVTNGTVDWNYVGMAQNEHGWWYISNGTVDWNYVGMAENRYGWWYISDGTVDWNYVGMAENQYGWWYIANGAVDWNYVGMAENKYGWWYIANGTVDWNYVGMAENQYGWWYIVNGVIDWNYNGEIVFGDRNFQVVNGFGGM